MGNDEQHSSVPSVTRRVTEAKRSFARQSRRAATQAEELVWNMVRNRRLEGLKFRRQVPLMGFVVDFYCPELRLVIELDGPIHESEQSRASDAERDQVLRGNGLVVVRIRNEQASEKTLREVIASVQRGA